ncbi:MAG: response regulator [Candidatus Tectomicrobia bacterium]|nr:response regulator [Candidatus Tectomicrobia bacterium]
MFKSLRILIVHDNQTILRIFREILDEHLVYCTQSGAEALAQAEKIPFDLAFTNHHLEEMNGVELALLLKKITPHLPIVLLARDLSSEVLEVARKHTAAILLAKPFSLTTIKAIVQLLQHEEECQESD